MPTLVDYSDLFERTVRETELDIEMDLQSRCPFVKKGIQSLYGGGGGSGGGGRARKRLKGDVFVRDLQRYLDSFGYERTRSQKRFHREMLGSALPHIYGSSNEFDMNKERILADHGYDTVQYEVLICTPRRWGKTTSVAMFVAACLLSTEDMWISCFSTGQRASTSLLDLAHKMICTVDGGKERVLKKNQEQLFIAGNGPSDVRKFFSYPSSVSVRPVFLAPGGWGVIGVIGGLGPGAWKTRLQNRNARTRGQQ